MRLLTTCYLLSVLNSYFYRLVIASQYDPWSILERLYPYLGGSASIVLHSPQVQILSDLQAKLRDLPGYLGPSLTEGFLRRYQVLPGRTHPMMNTSGTGGFILHAIKVYVSFCPLAR